MRLRTFLQSAPIPVIGLDRERRVTLWNAAAERLLGWTAEEVLEHCDPSVPPEVAAEQKTIVAAAFRGEAALQRESTRVTRAGELLDVEITTTLIPATTREPATALLLLHDVTEHRSAEEALAEREAQLRMVLEQLPAIISTFDAGGIVTAAQGGGLRELGVKSDLFLGRHYTEVISEGQPFARSMEAALHGEASSNEQEYRGRSFINRAEPLRSREGDIIGVINLGIDVTDLRRAREQLRRLTAALRLGLGDLRRDLRTAPAAALDRRIAAMLDLVDRATRHTPDDFGLRAAVEHETASFAERTGIDVQLSIRRDDLIDGDQAAAIYRIIQDSLTNVARHSGATRVDVRVEAVDERVETELRDNGSSLPEMEIDGTDTVRERAWALGGEAVIEPIPGDGTRVFVSFPQ
jgi:PAS domain S-box-containing protein